MRVLNPSIPEIEARWCQPSDELLSRIAAGDPSVPDELKKIIKEDPEQTAVVEALRNFEGGDVALSQHGASATQDPSECVEAPAWLMDLVMQKYQVNEQYQNTPPGPGFIVSVDRLIGPRGELPLDLHGPVAVMLDGEEALDIWYGWIAATETDYATDWDFVVQQEDGLLDPCLVGMIQMWNPVRVYRGSMNRVIGRLNPDRLAAVRALAAEFVTRGVDRATPSTPGAIGLRTTLNGLIVVTGTPLAGPSDPRWRYQQIYQEVAQKVRKPARLALAASAWRQRWWEHLLESFGQALNIEFRIEALAHAFMVGLPSRTLLQASSGMDEWLRFKIEPESEEPRIRLTIQSVTDDPVSVEILDRDGNDTLSLAFANLGQSQQADLMTDRAYVFRLLDAQGRSLEISVASMNIRDAGKGL